MPTATKDHARTQRHGAMQFGPAAPAAGSAAPASVGTPANPDAELIRVCHQFAASELENWYRYVVAPTETADEQDDDLDLDTYHWIVATPATTPEGWHAKALAFSAWSRASYDDHEDSRARHTSLLASLLRDMVAPARNAIIARLAEKFGPLPTCYTAEGIWIGYTPEERAAHRAESMALSKPAAPLGEQRKAWGRLRPVNRNCSGWMLMAPCILGDAATSSR